MNRGFWDNLPRPFFALAPMYDVTDVAFRRIVRQCARPHVFFTEFTSADGLVSEGTDHLMHMLRFDKEEKPIVGQIFGARPENFYKATVLLRELGFDGIDINMGCPDKSMMKNGSCAALFRTPELAKEIVRATKDGAGDLPVSIKIRIGDTKVDWENWIATLLETKPVAISIHLRTRKEMSKVPAHWELMPSIVKFIHDNSSAENRPLIIGNGDVMTLKEAKEKVTATGCDGIMIGRGVFSNPWVFAESEPQDHPPAQRLGLLLQHAQWFEQEFSGIKRFEVLKRFFKIYVHGFAGAAEVREKLYTATSAAEMEHILVSLERLN
jgi:nifR3 family TIM-barrel protein